MNVRRLSYQWILWMLLLSESHEDSLSAGSTTNSSNSNIDNAALTEQQIQDFLNSLPPSVHKNAEGLQQQIQDFLSTLPEEVREKKEDLKQQIQEILDDLPTTETFLNNKNEEDNKDGDDDDDDDGGSTIGNAISGLFQLGAEALGLSGGDDDDNNNNPQEQHQGSSSWGMETDHDKSYDYIKDIITFNPDLVYTNISMGDGMEEVASYFGVDITDPAQMDRFIKSFGACKFCDSDDIDPNLQFLGLDCSDWFMFSLFSEQEECAVLRAIAVENCGCQNKDVQTIQPTTERCSLCGDGSLEGVTLEKRIPTLSNELSCEDINRVPAVEGDKTCDAVAGYDYICGCSGAEPKCHLCPGGDNPLRPDAIIKSEKPSTFVARYAANPNYIPPEVESLTCASFAHHLKMNTQSTCSFAIQDMERETGLSISSYCGCPNVDHDGGCEPCPLGYQLIKDDENMTTTTTTAATETARAFEAAVAATCIEWATQFAPHLKDDKKCQQTQQDMKSQCCEPIPPPPLNKEDEEEGPSQNETEALIVALQSSSSATPAQSMDLVSWTAPVPMAIILVVAFVR